MHQPTPKLLKYLDETCAMYNGRLFRVDVAFDFRVGRKRGDDVSTIAAYLTDNAFLKYERGALMHDVGAHNVTTYWGPEIATRNVALYCDKPSKWSRYNIKVAHFEIRITSSSLLLANGIHKPSDITQLDPKRFFDRHVVVTMPLENAIATRYARFANKIGNHAERKRAQAYYSRYQFHRLQNFRTVFGHIKYLKINDELAIPTQISWPVRAGKKRQNKCQAKKTGFLGS